MRRIVTILTALFLLAAGAAPQASAQDNALGGAIIGGGIGAIIARRIQMTALPQLVAAFHSLVGLAAVCVATPAFYDPGAYNIGSAGAIHANSLVEMSLGTAIGAITFTGSIIAFGKLQALITGKPLVFPGQHPLNALLGIVLVLVIVWFVVGQSPLAFWAIVVLSLALGLLLIVPIGGADMPVVISMLNSYSGWAACGIGFTLANSLLIITGALVGSSGAILSYIMCKGMNRSIFNVILGGFDPLQRRLGQVAEDALRDLQDRDQRPGLVAILLENRVQPGEQLLFGGFLAAGTCHLAVITHTQLPCTPRNLSQVNTPDD